jgi:hypothetical protein
MQNPAPTPRGFVRLWPTGELLLQIDAQPGRPKIHAVDRTNFSEGRTAAGLCGSCSRASKTTADYMNGASPSAPRQWRALEPLDAGAIEPRSEQAIENRRIAG